ncbi:MAG: energy-coupling factor transporter transmembrane protein EcfT [Ruminococcaceae bacterium]|nr:energy-coupling factor transporter transmembrane protein EcfT [Oscillospiraceae bacterium]
MLKDITFGQYIFGRSIIHRLDPRVKIILTFLYIILLFTAKTLIGFGICVITLILVYAISGIPFKMALKSLKPIMPVVILTGILNTFFIKGESEPLLSFWIITVYREALVFACILALRIICLVTGSSVLTYTTSPIELTDGIERLLKPLRLFKLPIHELAMMMTIALRMIPTLIDETIKITNAQKSRGADLDSGNLKQKIKALVPILVPLFVSSFRRADDLALAMESRCYRGGEGRTRMKQLRFRQIDFWVLFAFAIIAATVIIPNYLTANII